MPREASAAGSQEPGYPEAPWARWRLTGPLRTAVTMILAATAGLLAFALPSVLLGAQVSIFGLGHGSVCTVAPLNGLTEGGSLNSILAHVRRGATSFPSQLSVCASQPTAGQRTLVTLSEAPTFVFFITILLLLAYLLRTVRRTGPFAGKVTRRIRFLGWFILGGWLAVTAGQSVAQSYFVGSTVTDTVPVISNAVNAIFAGFIPPVLIACGLLTLARLMRVGTQMNDDLAGTV